MHLYFARLSSTPYPPPRDASSAAPTISAGGVHSAVALCLLPSDHLYESKVPEIREPSVRYIAKPTAGEAERCYTVRRRWTAHLQFVKVKFGIHLKFNFDFDIDMYGCCHDNGGLSSHADVLYTS